MYDNYSMPDPRFYKLYKNKIREMPSLKTSDIQGAQPKKTIHDRNDFVNEYYTKLYANQKPQGPAQISYWPTPKKDQSANQLQSSASGINLPEYAKPEDYSLPRDYRLPQNAQQQPQREYQAPYFNQAYQQQQAQQVQRNPEISMRNPMYSDFDYNKYSQQRASYNPNIKIEDSLDALQHQYDARNQGGYNQYPQQQQQQQEVNEFKKDWLNFYGMNTAPQGNQQQANRQFPATDKITSKAQYDPNLKASAAIFYGESLDEQDKFEKNLNAFFGTDSNSNGPVKSNQISRRQEHIFKPEVKLYNPLTRAPMLYYQKDPRKFERPKEMSVKEQWQFKKNAERFFAA